MGDPQNITIEGVSPGMEFGEASYGPVTREDIVAYARA